MTSFVRCTLLLFSGLMIFPHPAKSQSHTPSVSGLPASPFQQLAMSLLQEQEKAEVNSTIQSNLQEVLSGDPVLDGAEIETSVDDIAITLTGTVQSEGQHRRALQLASQYSQYRKIVDKLVVK